MDVRVAEIGGLRVGGRPHLAGSLRSARLHRRIIAGTKGQEARSHQKRGQADTIEGGHGSVSQSFPPQLSRKRETTMSKSVRS